LTDNSSVEAGFVDDNDPSSFTIGDLHGAVIDLFMIIRLIVMILDDIGAKHLPAVCRPLFGALKSKKVVAGIAMLCLAPPLPEHVVKAAHLDDDAF
jgi:hypothetical protein